MDFWIPSTKIIFVWLASLVFKAVIKSFLSIQRSDFLKKLKNPIHYSYYNGKAFLPYVFLPAMLRVFDWIYLILNKHPIKDAFAFTILSLWISKIVQYVIFLKTKSLTESFNLTIQICILNLFYLFWISLGYYFSIWLHVVSTIMLFQQNHIIVKKKQV